MRLQVCPHLQGCCVLLRRSWVGWHGLRACVHGVGTARHDTTRKLLSFFLLSLLPAAHRLWMCGGTFAVVP